MQQYECTFTDIGKQIKYVTDYNAHVYVIKIDAHSCLQLRISCLGQLLHPDIE